jgi:hypothetical protein
METVCDAAYYASHGVCGNFPAARAQCQEVVCLARMAAAMY